MQASLLLISLVANRCSDALFLACVCGPRQKYCIHDFLESVPSLIRNSRKLPWSNNCSSSATHLWSSALNSLWFRTQQLPGGELGRRWWFSFLFFFLSPDSSAKWGDWMRKQETHESPRIISLCLGGLLFSLLLDKIDKRKGKAIRSECLVALADCNPLSARHPHGLFVSTYFG